MKVDVRLGVVATAAAAVAVTKTTTMTKETSRFPETRQYYRSTQDTLLLRGGLRVPRRKCEHRETRRRNSREARRGSWSEEGIRRGRMRLGQDSDGSESQEKGDSILRTSGVVSERFEALCRGWPVLEGVD